MTFDELKAEAKRQGYSLIKKRPYIKRLPCKCGCNEISLFYGSYKTFYRCDDCGFEVSAKNEYLLKEAWNKAVSEE